VATASDGLRVRARERACELMNDLALAPPGRTTPRKATSWLAAAKRRRAQLGRGTERKRVGLFPFPGEHVRMRGCMGMWICARVCACACRGHGHGDGRDNGGDATTGKNERQNEEERPASGAACAAKTAAAPARNDIPAWLDDRHHTARARRRGDISGHGGEHIRLDTRP
jgi:hypothetical protein